MDKSSNLNRNNYFIKGDISGIQDFIFNVKSEKAARVLKARSMFVQLFSEFSFRFLQERLSTAEIEVVSNNGGSFYLYANHEKRSIGDIRNLLKEIEKNINDTVHKENFYLVLSAVEYNNRSDFKEYSDRINFQAAKDKFRKNHSDYDAFEPYTISVHDLDWLSFAHYLPKNKAEIVTTKQQGLEVFRRGINLLSGKLQLEKNIDNESDYFDKKIHNQLPEWRPLLFKRFKQDIRNYNQQKKDEVREGFIIDYHFLSRFAELRTGTGKLGVLKMDADNFGKMFAQVSDVDISKEISGLVYDFFRKKINELLDKYIVHPPYFEEGITPESNPCLYRDNIYTVYSGGDDCFFVGAWDVIFDWAILVRNEFTSYAKKIVELLSTQAEGNDEIIIPFKPEPSLSGGVVLVDPTYPVIQFSNLAEEAVGKAKKFKFYDKEEPNKDALKDKISVFDQVLSWQEFKSARNIAKILQDNMAEDTRSLIERIKRSAEGYEKLQEKALRGEAAGPSVAKLFYFIRNKKEAEVLSSLIIQPYAKDLMEAFVEKKPTNPLKYAVAARWADFLTRKSTN